MVEPYVVYRWVHDNKTLLARDDLNKFFGRELINSQKATELWTKVA